MFAYLYTGGNYSSGTGVNPPASSLPANAHIDYFRVYDAKPQAVKQLSFDRGGQGQPGGRQFRQHAVHLHRHPFGRHEWDEQRGLGGDRQRGSPANEAHFTGAVLPSGTLSFTAGQTSRPSASTSPATPWSRPMRASPSRCRTLRRGPPSAPRPRAAPSSTTTRWPRSSRSRRATSARRRAISAARR